MDGAFKAKINLVHIQRRRIQPSVFALLLLLLPPPFINT
jgi:hypothetical protein